MEVLAHHQEKTPTSWPYSKEGFSIPYLATERDDETRVPYTQEKKTVFKFFKIHWIRYRGHRSTPLITSLARKLDRFKVRMVVAQDPSNDNR